ncbi:MAG: oligopeptide/dipeptide ABC transporter ATP-binding protein, partial [Rhodothermales bacterium]
TNFPSGCPFHPRCPYRMDVCPKEEPILLETEPGHTAACWLHDPSVMAAQGRPAGIPEEAGKP